LSQYYVEATDKDLSDFAAMNSLHIADATAFVSLADNWIRRKVSLISQSGILDNYTATEIAQAANAFGINVKIEQVGGKDTVSMPSNKSEIKQLLRFLDEDYYHSVIQSKPYVTNSKRPA
jgi:uncharacterized protein YaiI (UPF0178 family)